MKDLTIIIPARCEMFLLQTIQDALQHIEASTEVIAILDGTWAQPPIPQDPRVNIIYLPEAIGQRAATNLGVRLAQGKYVCKVDAHCSFDQGFDRKMLEAFRVAGDNTTMVPIMRNLHAFDWVCTKRGCGWSMYQGPTPARCPQCNERHHLRRRMVWVAKSRPQSTSYCFNSTPHFQYFEDYKHREKYIRDRATRQLTETMSLQGSCFMTTRERYWELDLSQESLGNWGNQGIEVACKSWLSGGEVLVNHTTYYAHMFRTQGGDFSFPWPVSGRDVSRTKRNVRGLFWDAKWPLQTHPLSWLVKRFWPVPGWTEADLETLPC